MIVEGHAEQIIDFALHPIRRFPHAAHRRHMRVVFFEEDFDAEAMVMDERIEMINDGEARCALRLIGLSVVCRFGHFSSTTIRRSAFRLSHSAQIRARSSLAASSPHRSTLRAVAGSRAQRHLRARFCLLPARWRSY